MTFVVRKKVFRHAAMGIVAALFSVGSLSMMTAEAKPVKGPATFQGHLVVGGQAFPISYVRNQQSAYISESQLVTLLNRFGLGAGVSGGQFVMSWLGQYRPKTAMVINGHRFPGVGAYAMNGNVYANLSALGQRENWQLQFNAETGTLQVQQRKPVVVSGSPTLRTGPSRIVQQPSATRAPSAAAVHPAAFRSRPLRRAENLT